MQKRLELNCNFRADADLRAAGEAEKHDLLHPSARAASSLQEKKLCNYIYIHVRLC